MRVSSCVASTGGDSAHGGGRVTFFWEVQGGQGTSRFIKVPGIVFQTKPHAVHLLVERACGTGSGMTR